MRMKFTVNKGSYQINVKALTMTKFKMGTISKYMYMQVAVFRLHHCKAFTLARGVAYVVGTLPNFSFIHQADLC